MVSTNAMLGRMLRPSHLLPAKNDPVKRKEALLSRACPKPPYTYAGCGRTTGLSDSANECERLGVQLIPAKPNDASAASFALWFGRRGGIASCRLSHAVIFLLSQFRVASALFFFLALME
jgi:hypothetical protein